MAHFVTVFAGQKNCQNRRPVFHEPEILLSLPPFIGFEFLLCKQEPAGLKHNLAGPIADAPVTNRLLTFKMKPDLACLDGRISEERQAPGHPLEKSTTDPAQNDSDHP